jgi:hypothetical protein
MSVIVTKCPVSEIVVSTGIEIERTTFDALPNIGSPLNCPVCGGVHVWSKNDAWLSDDGGEYRKQDDHSD